MLKYSLVFIFLLLPLVSANGLQISPNPLNITLGAGGSSQVSLIIQNQEPFTFQNISFENNPFISINKIHNLSSGSNITVLATVTANNNQNSTIRLKGFYTANVGQQNKIHHVNITQSSSKPCSFTIIEGDSVIWTNKMLSEVVLIDQSTGNAIDGSNIANNQTFEKQFITAQSFTYYISLSGFQFPEICTISVLDDSGQVNNPDLDALLNLQLQVQFPPTSLSMNVPITSYSTEFYVNQEGVITLTNTGSNIAKNINLNADWFFFSQNNFELSPGQTKVVSYTITPVISQTTDTNKNYTKLLNVTGNFGSLSQNINVFIKHANIGNNSTSGTGGLKELFDKYCKENPSICNPNPQIIYIGNGSQSFNVSLTQAQWEKMQIANLEKIESDKLESNYQREKADEILTKQQIIENKSIETDNKIQSLQNQLTEKDKASDIILGVGGGFSLMGLIGLLIWHYKKENLVSKYKTWSSSA